MSSQPEADIIRFKKPSRGHGRRPVVIRLTKGGGCALDRGSRIFKSLKCGLKPFEKFALVIANRRAILSSVIGISILSGCSRPSEQNSTSAQLPGTEERSRNDAEDKAWVEASRNGTAEA